MPAKNAPVKIDIQEGQITSANKSIAHLKHGRPLGSKNKNSRKKREQNNNKIEKSLIDHRLQNIVSDKIQPP